MLAAHSSSSVPLHDGFDLFAGAVVVIAFDGVGEASGGGGEGDGGWSGGVLEEGKNETGGEGIAGAEAVGAHKTSMLQDLERGRAMEIDALVSAVQELGRLVEVPTPTLDAVLALVRLRGFKAGAYGLTF